MEHLISDSINSIPRLPRRHCQARMSEICERRGGWIESNHARSARYCSLCAPLVRREQSKQRKREMRREDWRKYHNDYSPFDKQQWRDYHREHMREWRARRRQAEPAARVDGQRHAA